MTLSDVNRRIQAMKATLREEIANADVAIVAVT